jgi:AraC-like DNA-binding protein
MQRLGVMVELPRLLKAAGIDSDLLLIENQLNPGLFKCPDNAIPFERACALARSCCDATNDESFWIRLGAETKPEHLGPLGAYMASGPNLASALQDLVTVHPRYVRGGAPYLIERSRRAMLIAYRAYVPSARGVSEMSRGAMAFGATLFRHLTGEDPAEVLFSNPEPVDLRAYADVFGGAPLKFNQKHYGLVYSSRSLAAPIKTADGQARRNLSSVIAEWWKTSEPDIQERLIRALVPLVLTGGPSLAKAAKVIGMHPATLSRKLQTEGITFRDALNRSRFELSSQLLLDAHFTISEVAETLGYSDVSAFTRFFASMSGGLPPAEWRRKHEVDTSGLT